jgi:hypothetical protein
MILRAYYTEEPSGTAVRLTPLAHPKVQMPKGPKQDL